MNMSSKRQALSDKIIIVGIDGMDPRLTRKLVEEGKMPATKTLLERGAAREDLVMLGAQPTITPPMWTTLATGAYPVTHGITCYWRQSKERMDQVEYNFYSDYCQAEQLWNVFAEAGKKTLVWNWPGSSWPPSSDDPHLHVVDGTQPAGVNCGNCADVDVITVASVRTEELVYREKASSDGRIPCVIADLDVVQEGEQHNKFMEQAQSKKSVNILLSHADGEGALSEKPFDVVLSPIAEIDDKWAVKPAGAKTFTLLTSKGLIRRYGQILCNEEGKYDRVAIYRTRQDLEPLAVLHSGEIVVNILDEAIKNDERLTVNRHLRLLELAEDGTYVKLWISNALNIHNDGLWHPKTLYKDVVEHVGFAPPYCLLGGDDAELIEKCMIRAWDEMAKWQADALNYLIHEQNFEIIFSHFHNIDLEGHMIVKYLYRGKKNLPAEAYQKFMEMIYIQADHYISRFLPLLDEGWTVLLVSDHAAVCPEHQPQLIGDPIGVSVGLMRQLGFTEVKKDAAGQDLKEIDWAKTKAIAIRGNHIYLNLVGRSDHGIVQPQDQYELEEEIMTALYGYQDPQTHRRVIALALRKKDAVLLGMGGPESGDILFWTAEGYNLDHGDSLSTTEGTAFTSVSPIFIAAGQGIKAHHVTKRIIRQVDVAPTVAVLGGVRMPAQCEGAPIYQILAEEF